MAFRFNLEQILKYRDGLEDQAQEKLAKKKQELKKADGRLQNLRTEQENMRGVCRQQVSQKQSIDVVSLSYTYQYINRLGERIEDQAKEKSKCQAKVNRQREEVKKCWQEKRVMEILKDKMYNQYLEEEKKVEQSVLDELSLQGFIRNKNGSPNL